MTLQRRATVYLLLTTAIWGSTFLAGKVGLDVMAGIVPEGGRRLLPLWLNAMRFGVAAVFFLMVCPRAVRLTRREWRDSLWLALPGAVGVTVGGWGLQDATVTITAFLTSLTVIFTPLFGFLFFRERLSRLLLVGAAVTFAGVFLLTDPRGGRFGWPETLVLASAVCFGLQIQLANVLTPGRDPERMTFGFFVHFLWLMVVPHLFFAAGREMLTPDFLARAFGPAGHPRWIERWGVLWTTLHMGIAASAVSMWIFVRYQKELPATRAAVLYCVEPVFAALLALWILHEPMTVRKAAGAAVIVAGNLVCEIFKRKP